VPSFFDEIIFEAGREILGPIWSATFAVSLPTHSTLVDDQVVVDFQPRFRGARPDVLAPAIVLLGVCEKTLRT